MITAGLLSAFVCAWILTAYGWLPTLSQKRFDTTETFQAESSRVNQGQQLSIDLRTAIERVADEAIPALVHIVVKEHQEMANPFLQYKDNPFFGCFFGLPKDMPKKLERELIGIGTGVIIDAKEHSFNELITLMPHHQKVILFAISHKTGQSGYVQVEIL